MTSPRKKTMNEELEQDENCTHDYKQFAYFSFDKGHIGKIDLKRKEIVRTDQFMKWFIRNIKVMDNRRKLICADEMGYLKIFSVDERSYAVCLVNFRRVHKSTIYGLIVFNKKQLVFTSSWDCKVNKIS